MTATGAYCTMGEKTRSEPATKGAADGEPGAVLSGGELKENRCSKGVPKLLRADMRVAARVDSTGWRSANH